MDSYWDSIKNEHVPKNKINRDISKSDKKKDNKNLSLSNKSSQSDKNKDSQKSNAITYFIINNVNIDDDENRKVSNFVYNTNTITLQYLNSHYLTNIDGINLKFFTDFCGIKEKVNCIFR